MSIRLIDVLEKLPTRIHTLEELAAIGRRKGIDDRLATISRPLTRITKGAWVLSAVDNDEGVKGGKIKEWDTTGIWVVYDCDGDWENYQKYPGVLTRLEALRSYTLMENRYEGTLDLRGQATLTELPVDLHVTGSLVLNGLTDLKELPEGLTVGKDLHIEGCVALTALPKKKRIRGNVFLAGCAALGHKKHSSEFFEGIDGSCFYVPKTW